jgi:glycosyltransferase involved in cell wall biosynthesis
VYRIAAWSWELEVVPRSWARRARAVNEFWAHTRFIADAARRVLPVPVVHMLPGVELLPFTPLPRAHFGLPEERTLFLFAFDMASVLERKNPLGLIRAFREAFTPSDRAALVLKISRGDADPESLSRLSAAAREAGVYLIDRIMPRAECTALFNCCDCYVSLHRSEGFGFTMVEAMLLGKPVVATGYSGNVDFMTPDTSLLIPYTLVALERDCGIYPKGARWAEPSISDAAAAMRWVYEHPAEAAALGERGRRHVAEVLSFEVYGRRIQARLAELQRPRAAGRV